MEALLGDTLLDPQGNKVATSSVAGGAVFGLYFSAHWCPPCRGFTPKLSAWNANFQKAHADKKLVLVFVSSDRSEEDFAGYHKEMTFHALPYEDRERKNTLSKRFKIEGIPTLLFLDGEGNLLNSDGRSIVMTDPEGLRYPWKPKPFLEEVSGPLLRNSGGEDFTEYAALEGKYIAWYFSASWCGPCRGFTPKLVETYQALQAAGKAFEVILVSGDEDDENFTEYYSHMPWLAIPFGDSRIEYLNTFFKVQGIPTLVLTSPAGKLLRDDARSAVQDDPTGADFPWPRKALNVLSNAVDTINEVPTLVVFSDGGEADVAMAKAALGPAAQEEEAYAQAHDGEMRTMFAYNTPEDGEGATRILNFLGLTAHVRPLLVYIDISERKKYVHKGEINAEAVGAFLAAVKGGTAEARPVREEDE